MTTPQAIATIAGNLRQPVGKSKLPRWAFILAIVGILATGAVLLTIKFATTAGSGATAQTPISAPSAVQSAAPMPAAQSTQIERPALPAFKGRTAPSKAFPLSDKEYIAAGKNVLDQRSDISGVTGLWQSLGNPSNAKITPLAVTENYVWQKPDSLTVSYQVEASGGKKGALINVNFKQGATLVPIGIYTSSRW